MDISFRDEGTYLFAAVGGEWEATAVAEVAGRLRDRATAASRTRILVDAFHLSRPKTEFDQFLTGKIVAELLKPPFKIAVIYPEELVTRFTENTAVNRGANYFVCSDEEEALQWLLGDAHN